jgi:hypothetical protein
LTPDITQAFTAVILQRHRDVGTCLHSIGTGWDFEALTRIYWKYFRLIFRVGVSHLLEIGAGLMRRLVSTERGGVGAEVLTLRVGPRMGSETRGNGVWRKCMYGAFLCFVYILRITHP